jgi:hypothetical protein
MIVLNVELLKDEIASWNEKDVEVLRVLRSVSQFSSPQNGQIEDKYYNTYKHLGIFSDDKKLNDKAFAIIRILQNN